MDSSPSVFQKSSLMLIAIHYTQLSFQVGILAIFGNLEPHYMEQLKNKYVIVSRGYNSFPMNLPGTRYHKAMKVI